MPTNFCFLETHLWFSWIHQIAPMFGCVTKVNVSIVK